MQLLKLYMCIIMKKLLNYYASYIHIHVCKLEVLRHFFAYCYINIHITAANNVKTGRNVS